MKCRCCSRKATTSTSSSAVNRTEGAGETNRSTRTCALLKALVKRCEVRRERTCVGVIDCVGVAVIVGVMVPDDDGVPVCELDGVAVAADAG